MRYEVTWQDKGSTRFGIVIDPELEIEEYESDEDKAALQRGYVLVEDAITGEAGWVQTAVLEDIEADHGGERGQRVDPWGAYVAEQYQDAYQQSRNLERFGVGALIQLPVGDGRAYYVVTKLNKRSCVIAWRGFGDDRWTDQVLGSGGTFPLERIQPLWERARALDELFGRRS
jgi:hypothetical protein